MAAETTKNSGLELVWSVWNRRKWVAILAFAASFSAVLSGVYFLPNLYKSTSTVLVESDRVAVDLIKPAVTGEVDTRLQTINQQILSRSRLKELIERLDLYTEMRSRRVSMEDLVGHMRRNIGLELKNVEKNTGQRETIAFALSFQGRDPQTVSMVTNTLASFFVEENSKARGRQANETAEFLSTQLQDMRKRLDGEEARVTAVRRRHGGGESRMQVGLMTLERMNSQLRLTTERLDRAMDRRENLARQIHEIRSDPVLGSASKENRLLKLRQELAELRTRYTDNYPDVIRLRSEIAAMERAGDAKSQEGGATIDPTTERLRQTVSEVDAEIKSLKSEETRLQQAIAAHQQRIESTSFQPEQPTEAVRDYESTKELYNSLLKRYVDARQAEGLEQRQQGEKFRVLDAAIPPQYPVAPNRFLLSLIGLFLSLCLAVGAVLVAEQIDTSFHSVDDLRAFTKVPVLVSIPVVVTEQDLGRKARRFRLGLAASLAGLMLIVGFSYYFAHDNEGLVRMLARQRSAQSGS